MNDVLFSSKRHDWETPQPFFDKLDREFHFTLDPCCTPDTAKCKKYYTPKENGLLQDWDGETVFCNPLYGRDLKTWIEKCYFESRKPNTTVVMLIPARTDTIAFHNYIYIYIILQKSDLSKDALNLKLTAKREIPRRSRQWW